MLRVMIGALAASLLAGCSFSAMQVNDGLAAFNRGDCKTAAEKWQAAIKSTGRPEAVSNMGLIYERGCAPAGIAADHHLAFQHYAEAASRWGYPQAIHNVGSLYERGLGRPADLDKALQYYHLAARHGNAMSRQRLIELGQPLPATDLAYRDPFDNSRHLMQALSAGLQSMPVGPPPGHIRQTHCSSSGGYTNCSSY